MSNVFFTSDQHFDHPAIMKYSPMAFTSLAERNESIVQAYNSVVKDNDRVYHLGDVAWKNHRQWLKRLNGHKILLVGNHDKMSIDALECFNEVYDCCRTSINGQKIIMMHFPMESWWSKGGGAWMLHGHTHCIKLITNKRLYVGVDARRDYMPWHFDELKDVIDELPKF